MACAGWGGGLSLAACQARRVGTVDPCSEEPAARPHVEDSAKSLPAGPRAGPLTGRASITVHRRYRRPCTQPPSHPIAPRNVYGRSRTRNERASEVLCRLHLHATYIRSMTGCSHRWVAGPARYRVLGHEDVISFGTPTVCPSQRPSRRRPGCSRSRG